MPFGEVQLIPGIDVEKTPTLNKAGISDGNLIRWREGLVEKIGGWAKFYPLSVGSIPRDLHAWQDINNVDHLSVGATQSLAVITTGVLQTITPQKTTTNTAPNFSTVINTPVVTIVDSNIVSPTTNNSVFIAVPVSIGGLLLQGLYKITANINTTTYQIDAGVNATATVNNAGTVPTFTTATGSSAVIVNEIGHGLIVGESASFLVSTSVGGTAVSGTYLVQSSADADHYTISVTPPATGIATVSENGGNVQFIYYIAIGPQAAGQPYGAGPYGTTGGYGLGTAAPVGPGTPITAVDWTSDNWGEILISCPQGGGIYQWAPDSGFQTAQLLPNAPISNTGIFLAMPLQMVIAFGSSFSGVPNPLGINWCASGDFADWIPTSANQAGGYQIPSGSRIVGGRQASQQGLIWTDVDLWSMQYVGYPNVFGFSKIMIGCGLIGGHAHGVLGSTVYWMSQKQFFTMAAGGAPKPMPCTVWDYVFQNLDTVNAYKIRCKPNSQFGTIGWEFPSLSGGTGENDSYVEYNTVEGEWTKGQYPGSGRSAWIDQSVFGPPIAANPQGIIYQHEVGYDGDGAPINPTFTTGYFVIASGEDFCFLDQFIPDFKYGLNGAAQTANLLVTLYAVDYPTDTPRIYGPYPVNTSQRYFMPRIRGRQIAMQAQSQDAGSFWRLGLARYRYALDGRR